jgi:hypothetical protein
MTGLGAILFLLPSAARAIELGLPIDCKLGKTCWIQQYFDHDPGKERRDYACGTATYDGHDGTDFRIQDTSDVAAVIASAPGTVRATRDGMPDRLVQNDQDRSAIADKECGNGVVIDHDDGWQTQYCHLRQGSVEVKTGDRVERGTKLGMVGYSGLAAFPHVHVSLRRGQDEVDPFNPMNAEACGMATPLWQADLLPALEYRRGDIIGSGFAPGKVEMRELENGLLPQEPPAGDWPAMVFYGWAINLEEGDELTVTLTGPDGRKAENRETLDRPKAQYLLFSGMKRPAGGWMPGDYLAEFRVSKDGTVRLKAEQRARID